MAKALICFDVLSNYVLASTIDKMETGEKSLLRLLLPSVAATNAIFILVKSIPESERHFDF